jgi:transketolase
MNSFKFLEEKALWVRKETLKIHKIASGIRLASSLSCVEILTVLYYGKILKYYPKDIYNKERDRLIISKAHGSVSFYPILGDLGFFDMNELEMVGKHGSILGDIPDCSIPGYESMNGSLGHGLGVACGMALALKREKRKERVFVLLGDGELYEGSVWEAIMFAGHHNLDNLVLIIDNNKICMLDYCKKIIDIEPLHEKFNVFKWKSVIINGHDVEQLYNALLSLKQDEVDKPKVLIADTVKGKGVPSLENDPLCHVKSLNAEQIDKLLIEMK